jgi:serine/threonine protein kinase
VCNVVFVWQISDEFDGVLSDLGIASMRADEVSYQAAYTLKELQQYEEEEKKSSAGGSGQSVNETLEDTMLGRGTPLYMAPELIVSSGGTMGQVGRRSDVYAFGVVLWEMMSGKIPFSHLTGVSDLRALAKLVAVNGERPPLTSEWPLAMKELISRYVFLLFLSSYTSMTCSSMVLFV